MDCVCMWNGISFHVFFMLACLFGCTVFSDLWEQSHSTGLFVDHRWSVPENNELKSLLKEKEKT